LKKRSKKIPPGKRRIFFSERFQREKTNNSANVDAVRGKRDLQIGEKALHFQPGGFRPGRFRRGSGDRRKNISVFLPEIRNRTEPFGGNRVKGGW